MGLSGDGEQSQIEAQVPLLHSVHRTGTIWTAITHIITGVIGAGVLSLAWSIAQLGWVGGPVALFVFAAISLVSAFLLTDCYRTGKIDPEKANDEEECSSSYMQAVSRYLDKTHQRACALLVQESLYGTGLAYTITAAVSMRGIQKANCYHREGHSATCSYSDNSYMLMFGAVQIVMSQIPNFHNMEWLSATAAVMSFAYATIGLGLGVAKVIENGTIMGGIAGVTASSLSEKIYLLLQAVGDIAFAYPFSVIVLEIQDTLKRPPQGPSEGRAMKKASVAAISVTNFFYLFCGCFGYAAFGDDTPGNLLTGFGFYEPYWLIDFANACVVLHLVGGYQPVFTFIEGYISDRHPTSSFVNDNYIIKLCGLPPIELNLLRLTFRSAYVASTTALAMGFPYFNQVLGVLGALNFWPITIYFPVEMYMKKQKVGGWSKTGLLLRVFSFVLFLLSVAALVGSVEGLLSATFSS
ncbi:hypothetical protein V2J09_020470 [Rumex salicifolius]